MQITIHFAPGFQVEGVVLTIAGTVMRVAIQDWDDVAEFRRFNGEWLAENGDAVRIDGLPILSGSPEGFIDYRDERYPLSAWIN